MVHMFHSAIIQSRNEVNITNIIWDWQNEYWSRIEKQHTNAKYEKPDIASVKSMKGIVKTIPETGEAY